MNNECTVQDRRSEHRDEGELRGIYQRLARIEAKLDERCKHRQLALDDLERRVDALEVSEHRRRGGMAVMMALWAGAGAIGAAVAKVWSGGQ